MEPCLPCRIHKRHTPPASRSDGGLDSRLNDGLNGQRVQSPAHQVAADLAHGRARG